MHGTDFNQNWSLSKRKFCSLIFFLKYVKQKKYYLSFVNQRFACVICSNIWFKQLFNLLKMLDIYILYLEHILKSLQTRQMYLKPLMVWWHEVQTDSNSRPERPDTEMFSADRMCSFERSKHRTNSLYGAICFIKIEVNFEKLKPTNYLFKLLFTVLK